MKVAMRKPTFFLLLLSASLSQAQFSRIGSSVYGDFNGDGVKEYAFCVQTDKGYGNAIENGVPGAYSIYFSSATISEIKVGCCDVILINEGDLNDDGADDLSLYQAPMNGNTYSMKTMSLNDSLWNVIVPTFLIPNSGFNISSEGLQNKVYERDGIIYFQQTDFDNEGFITKETAVEPIN
ncbi:MAG: hypothetical protein ACI9UJ_000653 [bacterium]|jgi:hypothetical protein